MDNSCDKDKVLHDLAEALGAAMPLITAAANNNRVAAKFRTESRCLRAQALTALYNARPFWIPEPRNEPAARDKTRPRPKKRRSTKRGIRSQDYRP
jgi:hypothetical protein